MTTLCHFIRAAVLVCVPATLCLADGPGEIKPLLRVVDLTIGESADVELCDGSNATVRLIDLKETRDEPSSAVRRAEVTVEVNGKRGTLVSATYHRPQTIGGVQIDCSITKGYNENGSPSFWGLDKDARLRLWPAGSPLLTPGTFSYPARQKWFATDTQMANDPVYVDGGERAGERKIYYHSGLDIGGSEGLVEVVAATDSLVVSVGDVVLEGHKRDTPVSPRYDVVYLLDGRGWYYRYSHLKTIDKKIVPGRVISQGDRIGLLGKEGGSGGWSHLHFEIKSRQPSGKWGTQEGYAFLWEAYQRQHKPDVIAVARPHHVVFTGETVTLDGSRSWAKSGNIAAYRWKFTDGATAKQSRVKRTYNKPGRYSEVLRVTDKAGHVSYDFAVVVVVDREHPQRRVPSIHPNYYPTTGIRAGDPVTFKVRTFNTTAGKEQWDFGDGSSPVEVQSDGNAVKLAPDGYAVTTHRFAKPGEYVVRVTRSNENGVPAIGHLHVHVGESVKKPALSLIETKRIWDRAPHNAFTDLLRHKGRLYCVFREGRAHVSPDGALRVITSDDGGAWESLALVESDRYDLRDAKITVAPKGDLMLNGAGMIADADVRYYSRVWFSSDDGRTWDAGRQVGDPGFWLWRTQWQDGRAYSFGYSTERDRTKRKLRLYRSNDGRKWETIVKQATAPAGCGEDRILFLRDGTALCLLRHETGDKMAQLGTSKPPYTEWTWRDLNYRIGGPNMIQLPDGRILAATRLYNGGTRTSLSWLDAENAKLTEVLKLPSGGDTSYPGLVWHADRLWVSYYSSHEGEQSRIYFASLSL